MAYEFTEEQLDLFWKGMAELKKRNLHWVSYTKAQTMYHVGTISQDDLDLVIDCYNADPSKYEPKWYNREDAFRSLRERFNE